MFDRIKYLAEKQKISLTELSEHFGWSSKAIYGWKNSTPSVDKVKLVADYFGVTVDYLLDGEEKELELRNALKGVMSFDGQEMTEEDKEAIINYMMGRKSK